MRKKKRKIFQVNNELRCILFKGTSYTVKKVAKSVQNNINQ